VSSIVPASVPNQAAVPASGASAAPMRLAVIGCGLLGGSLAGAWRQCGAAALVRGFDLDRVRLAQARELGFIDEAATTLAAAVADADCIVLATPVGAMEAVLEQAMGHARADAIVTDVGSTKGELRAGARRILGATCGRYVPAHPIAGGALPGIEHAREDLFAGRWVITTPDADTDAHALARIESAWRACGARVERMDADEHDRVFAAISHLPHLLAFALVHQIATQDGGTRMLRFAGAGFRDFSRIAASDPTMWRDIALSNRAALGAALAAYRAQLDVLQAVVAAGDGPALDRLFARASRVRREQTFMDGVQDGYDD
jgi:prephenate dehydrogenase